MPRHEDSQTGRLGMHRHISPCDECECDGKRKHDEEPEDEASEEKVKQKQMKINKNVFIKYLTE